MDRRPVERREVIVTETPTPETVYRRQQVVHDVGAEERAMVAKFADLLWLLFGILDMLIVIRFVLKLIAANPNNGFAKFIYNVTGPFVGLFEGLTSTPTFRNGVIEIHSLIAVVVYSLLAWIVVRLFWVIFYPPSKRRVVSTYEERD